MAHSVTFTSTLPGPFVAQIEFAPRRQVSLLVNGNSSVTLSASSLPKGVSFAQFLEHPEIARLIAGSVSGVTAAISWDEAAAATSRPAALELLQAASGSGLLGSDQTFYVSVAAGAGGAPDDVTLWTVPFDCVLLDASFLVTTTVATETLTLRDTAGGAGAALSSALSSTNAVRVATTLNSFPVMSEGDVVFGRRSDSAMAGVVAIKIQRTAQ